MPLKRSFGETRHNRLHEERHLVPSRKREEIHKRSMPKTDAPEKKTAARGSAGKDATTAWRKAAPKKRARKPHRPDALIVEANGKTYSNGHP